MCEGLRVFKTYIRISVSRKESRRVHVRRRWTGRGETGGGGL